MRGFIRQLVLFDVADEIRLDALRLAIAVRQMALDLPAYSPLHRETLWTARAVLSARTTEDLLQVEHGSLYPALHRLERKGWIAAKWEAAGKDLKREFKYYRLTAAGRKQLVAEESKWKKLTGAVARIMWPAEES